VTKCFKILLLKANLWIRLFLCFFIFTLEEPVKAQTIPQNDIQKAYQYYFNFEFDSCSLILEKTPPNPWSFYISSLLSSTEVFINDDPTYYKVNKFLESELLDSLDKLSFAEEHVNFLKSEIKLQWAILKLKNGDEFSAFWNLKQAYSIAKSNVVKYPDFIPSYKTLGLLHVLYGVFPNKYDWILSIFGIVGNAEKGMDELQKVQQSEHLISAEATLISALLQAYMLNNPEKAAAIMAPFNENNEFLLVDYANVLILMKNAQSEVALKILNSAFSKYAKPIKITQLYYLNGEIYLQKNNLDYAIENYEKFLSVHQGKDLIKDAYYKIGICYLIKNMPEKSDVYFMKSKENGWTRNEADKYAVGSLERDIPLNKDLLKLRYATDGGYYENALKIHEEIDTSGFTDHDLCEYYYRSARLFHRLNNIQKAIENYQNTINSQEEKSWYFAPNSALQLALIYTSRDENENAKKYLKLLSDYGGYPYQNSIRQKAKSALKKID